MTHNVDDFFEQWAENGEFPELDQLDFRASTSTPAVGTDVELRWHSIGGLGCVNIYKNGSLWLPEQANSGHHQLRVDSLDEIVLRAELGAVCQELHLSPVVDEPQLTRLKIDSRAYIGEPIKVSYRATHAERVEIQCHAPSLGYSQLLVHDGSGAQRCEFMPSEPGEYEINITAYSQHAAISDAGIKRVSHVVLCQHAPAKITQFRAAKKKAVWGEDVAINWRVDNAQAVWLIEGNDEPVAVDARAEYTVTAPTDPCRAEYRLVAMNHGGDKIEKSIAIRWRFPAPSLSLSATQKRIGLGDATTLQWQVSNVQQWWLEAEVNGINQRLKINQDQQEQLLRPGVNTLYRLVGVGLDGKRIQREIIIKVNSLPSWKSIDSLYKGLGYKNL